MKFGDEVFNPPKERMGFVIYYVLRSKKYKSSSKSGIHDFDFE